MTQPTKGPTNLHGSKDTNKDAAGLPGPYASGSSGPSPVRASPVDAVAASSGKPATPATHVVPSGVVPSGEPSSSKSGAACSTSSGPKSPGSSAESHESGECCDPKSASSAPSSDKGHSGSKSDRSHSGDESRSDTQRQSLSSTPSSPTSPKGTVDDLPTPTQSLGIRQVKGDDNRSSQAPASASGASNADSRGASTSVRADTVDLPVASELDSGRRNLTRPQDPKEFGRNDPIQPKRSAPTQPSYVAQPSIGGASATGDDDAEAS